MVISSTESFLAKSLVSKIESNGIGVGLSRGEIKDIDQSRDATELIILFMNEDIGDMTDTLVYLKDMANDLDRRLILIGEAAQYETACKTIPETLILEWFKRPLAMDELIKCVRKYLEENTGEKRKKTILIVNVKK